MSMIKLRFKLTAELKTIILLLSTFLLVGSITACSSSSDESELWGANSYSTEHDGTHIDLSIHSLDGVEDILQADVMIHLIDGSGASFEVRNASVEQDDDMLSFDWTDGFENTGSATIKILSEKEQTVLLKLKVDEVVNERNMMFIKDYELTKNPTGPTDTVDTKNKEDE